MKTRFTTKFGRTAIIISLVLVVLATAFAAGCGDKETVTTTATATTTSTATATTTTTQTATATETQVIKPITLVFSSHDVEGGQWDPIFQPFFAEIEQKTNGGIIIEDHWNGELAGFFEAYGTVSEGTVDMAQCQAQMYPNLFPMEDITALPSYDAVGFGRAQMWNELTFTVPEIEQAFIDSNTKILFRTSTYPNYASVREGADIKTLADFQGKKLLSTGQYDKMKWEALGAIPTSSMPEETVMNVQTGVMDGVYFSASAVLEFGMADIVKSMTACNYAGGVFSCVINLDVWNSLSKEYQDIIMAAAAKVPAIQDAQQQQLDTDNMKALMDLGVKLYELSAADMATMSDTLIPIREYWVNAMDDMGLPGQQVMDKMLELEDKYCR